MPTRGQQQKHGDTGGDGPPQGCSPGCACRVAFALVRPLTREGLAVQALVPWAPCLRGSQLGPGSPLPCLPCLPGGLRLPEGPVGARDQVRPGVPELPPFRVHSPLSLWVSESLWELRRSAGDFVAFGAFIAVDCPPWSSDAGLTVPLSQTGAIGALEAMWLVSCRPLAVPKQVPASRRLPLKEPGLGTQQTPG